MYIKKLVSINIICFFVQRSIIIISICKWDCLHVFKSIVNHFLFYSYTVGKIKVHKKKHFVYKRKMVMVNVRRILSITFVIWNKDKKFVIPGINQMYVRTVNTF